VVVNPSRRTAPLALAAVPLVALSACGLPSGGDVRTVAPDEVPYHLLDARPPASDGGTGARTTLVPVVFWLVGDDRLAPAAVGLSCSDAPEELVSQLLTKLAAAPDETQRAAGRSSAVPPESRLRLLGIVDGVARVQVDPAAPITGDRLPLVVGQVVLSVTTSPGVDRVSFVADDAVVPVPLPDGPLTSRPVTADDYAALLSDHFQAREGSAASPAPGLGCRQT
jgi:hypothetical protein